MSNPINNLFDTSKPIIDELAKYGNDLPDYIFTQALNEYGLTSTEQEEAVQDEMYNSPIYLFERHETGWYVSTVEDAQAVKCKQCQRKKLFEGEGAFTDKEDWYCCQWCLQKLIASGAATKHGHY